MSKLRKMLGDVNSEECLSLMRLMETQSEKTLSAWAVDYAKRQYLPIYETRFPKGLRLREAISACEEYLKGGRKRSETMPLLKEAGQIAREAAGDPAAQAAARAVSTACAAIRTPTSALGFLFYGAAATAYNEAGLSQTVEAYDRLASLELEKALASLRAASVPDEPHPAKLNWYC